jgi:hypothetical protein
VDYLTNKIQNLNEKMHIKNAEVTIKRPIKMVTNKYRLLFKKIDDDMVTLTRNTLYNKMLRE